MDLVSCRAARGTARKRAGICKESSRRRTGPGLGARPVSAAAARARGTDPITDRIWTSPDRQPPADSQQPDRDQWHLVWSARTGPSCRFSPTGSLGTARNLAGIGGTLGPFDNQTGSNGQE